MAYLSTVGADRTAEGEFKIGEEPPVYGIGGDEIVIPDDTVYYVDGKPKNLAAGLGTTSYGVQVKVFTEGDGAPGNPAQTKRNKSMARKKPRKKRKGSKKRSSSKKRRSSSKKRSSKGRGSCPPGEIRRKGYKRRGYTTDEGTRVAATTVPSACIEDRGAPGKGPDVIEITHEGKLGGAGYLKKSAKTRHGLLDKCVSGWGYQSCLDSLNAMAVFGKRTWTKEQLDKVDQDRDWLVKKYGGPGSFSRAANHGDSFEVGRHANPKEIRRLKNRLMNG